MIVCVHNTNNNNNNRMQQRMQQKWILVVKHSKQFGLFNHNSNKNAFAIRNTYK